MALMMVVVLAACSVARPADDATGEEIYAMLCHNCHGPQLQGGPLGPSIAAGSNSADRPDAFLRFAILRGKGRMPSFDSYLDDDQVERLVEYIREVQRR